MFLQSVILALSSAEGGKQRKGKSCRWDNCQQVKKTKPKTPKYFSSKQLAGSSTVIMCKSMTCLLPQIVTQAQNTQLSLGPMPSNNQQNHRPQSPSGTPALLLDSCCIHSLCAKHVYKHFHRSVYSMKKTRNK